MNKNIFALGGAVATLAASWPVSAQNAAAASPQSGNETLDEVVVTAERRRTNLQTTPIAATVLTGDALATSGVTTVDQRQFISPAGTVNIFGQGSDFNFRGIG